MTLLMFEFHNQLCYTDNSCNIITYWPGEKEHRYKRLKDLWFLCSLILLKILRFYALWLSWRFAADTKLIYIYRSLCSSEYEG